MKKLLLCAVMVAGFTTLATAQKTTTTKQETTTKAQLQDDANLKAEVVKPASNTSTADANVENQSELRIRAKKTTPPEVLEARNAKAAQAETTLQKD